MAPGKPDEGNSNQAPTEQRLSVRRQVMGALKEHQLQNIDWVRRRLDDPLQRQVLDYQDVILIVRLWRQPNEQPK